LVRQRSRVQIPAKAYPFSETEEESDSYNSRESLLKTVSSLRDNPDATILDTAITEEMNYLVTRDRLMETRLPERLNKVRIYSKQYPELKIELIKEKKDLMSFRFGIASRRACSSADYSAPPSLP
jgi:predicted nucleic acid-binding protein